ncbi:MAG: hypothetical protein LBM05_02270 [Endomicrobium sp.]|jgi:hypothetical protein|nr:hypothetical protein [Endomicrobium sp.]
MRKFIAILLVCLLNGSAFCMNAVRVVGLEENARYLREVLDDILAQGAPCCRFESDDEIVGMNYETDEDAIRLKAQLKAQREALLASKILSFYLVKKFIFLGVCSMCSVLWCWFKMNILKSPLSIVVSRPYIMSKCVSVVDVPKNYNNNNMFILVRKCNYDKFLGEMWRSKNCIMTKSYGCLLS